MAETAVVQTGLTIEEHRDFGVKLKEVAASISKVLCLGRYNQISKPTRAMWQAVGAIDHLRSAMDGCVVQEHGRELSKEDLNAIYYGGPAKE